MIQKPELNQALRAQGYVLEDVTGINPEVPACPLHGEALIPEHRLSSNGAKQAGYWRCPITNKVFMMKRII